MEHAELNLDAAEWRIPGERMKKGELHIVPLSTQAVDILRGVQLLSGGGRYVFPSLLSRDRPISNNTLNTALRRLGYSNEEMTGHGFRTMASTLLNEKGWHPDLIELQLAHAERNKVRDAYNRAQRLEERRKMMQDWSNYLDGLRAGASGYLSKDSAPEELMKAVRTVLSGRRYVSAALAEILVADLDGDPDKPLHARLSTREFQIFCKLAAGRGVSDIANELSLSVKTVSTYRSRILEKMSFTANADITSYALRNGLIQ